MGTRRLPYGTGPGSTLAAGLDFPFGSGLTARRVLIASENVSFLRGVLEAEDGLAFMHGDGSGAVWVLAPEGRGAELDRLVRDLMSDGCLLGVYDPAPI